MHRQSRWGIGWWRCVMGAHRKNDSGLWAGVLLAYWDEGEEDWRVPLVIDYTYADPKLKSPGGRGKPGEGPDDTATREMEEEAGPKVSLDELKLLIAMKKVDEATWDEHFWYLFKTIRDKRPNGMKKVGDEGEIVQELTRKQIREKIALREVLDTNIGPLTDFLDSLPERPSF